MNMRHISTVMQVPSLRRQIMRRVYYSYLISLISAPIFWQGAFLGGAIILLGDWFHVASIINNLLAVPIGRVPDYVIGSFSTAISHGKLMAVLLIITVSIVALLSARRLVNTLARARLVASYR